MARLARQVADQIKGLIGRVALPGHDAPVKAGDIMILLPRREPFGSAIIRELKQLNVPVAGADRVTLTEQIGVMDLMALGRFVLLAEDNYTLAVLLRSPLCTVSEEELFKLAHGREGTLWSALQRRRDETPSFREAHDFLSAMRSRADFVPPFEFYAHALTVRGMRLKLLARLGHEANDAIDEFLSLAFAYEAANTPSLEGFLHWVERGATEIKRDMERGRDEVRVMTVHGAKGLEADIVILPDTTGVPSLTTDRGNLLYTDDGVLYPVANDEAPLAVLAAKQVVKERMLEEHRRLLYVALTRARDRLIVCGFEGKRGVQAGSWYALAQRAAEGDRRAAGARRGDDPCRRRCGGRDRAAAEPHPRHAPPNAQPGSTPPAPRERAGAAAGPAVRRGRAGRAGDAVAVRATNTALPPRPSGACVAGAAARDYAGRPPRDRAEIPPHAEATATMPRA